MGGGTDVDEAFRWLISNAGGGNIVVIRASGSDAYNPYIYGMGGIESVATIVFSSRTGAQDSWVNGRLREATGIFIAGGDQSRYMQFWNNTALQDSLDWLLKRGITIGGTSAGMAVLSEYAYTADRGSVTSTEALNNPFHPYISIGLDFVILHILTGVITDTHFYQRDRMGRSVVFLARNKQENPTASIRGIASDEATGVLIDAGGIGRVVTQSSSSNYVYFLEATREPTQCSPGRPISVDGIDVTRVGHNELFNLNTWSSTQGKNYGLEADDGVLSSIGNNGRIY